MKLTEVTQEKKGTYAAVRFSEKTKNQIKKYISDNNIPNAINPSKLHTTLLYSRKHIPGYTPVGKYDKSMIGKPGKFDVWKSSNEDGSSTNCLVVEYKCKDLEDRHNELMKKYNATYDFPTYKTHITLSYDIGDMDIKDLSDFSDTVPEIEIISEYGEDLDLSWAKNKGVDKK